MFNLIEVKMVADKLNYMYVVSLPQNTIPYSIVHFQVLKFRD